jgi:hypothetical protein
LSPWSRILALLGVWNRAAHTYRNRPGAQAARLAVEAKYPNAQVYEVWLRAHEADRDVVAVLYNDRLIPMRRGTPLYKLIVVRRDLLTTEELPTDLDSPYLIRGIK